MWQIKQLNEMTSLEFYQCLKLRIDTFVVEQQRIYHELDDDDLNALHVFHKNGDGQVDAYARVFANGSVINFGRVVTAPSVRGHGLGRPLMDHILTACGQIDPHAKIEILAQKPVTGYYKKFGFHSVSQPFIHEGSPHVKMVKLPND